MRIAERSVASCGVAVIAAFMAACGDMPLRPPPEGEATVQAGYGRAFGRINFVEDGKEVQWGQTFTTNSTLTLYLRANSTGEMHYLEVENTGHFFWPLRPGGYTILGLRMQRPASPGMRTSTMRLMAGFSIPEAGQATYLGELRIQSFRGRLGLRVMDKYEEDGLSHHAARIDAGRFRPAKSLMALESPPGKHRQVSSVCAGTWGIECTKEFQGVEPSSPQGTAQGFPVVASLTPLLEWKPSSRPAVTYDVAIYESHSVSPMPTLSAQSSMLRGALVDYAEGLTQPRYVPTAPLKPGTSYQWSVRLREVEVVSSWSTTSHLTFVIIAASRGSGNYFGFATPR